MRTDRRAVRRVGDGLQPHTIFPTARGCQYRSAVALAGGGLEAVGVWRIRILGPVTAVGDPLQPAVGIVPVSMVQDRRDAIPFQVIPAMEAVEVVADGDAAEQTAHAVVR